MNDTVIKKEQFKAGLTDFSLRKEILYRIVEDMLCNNYKSSFVVLKRITNLEDEVLQWYLKCLMNSKTIRQDTKYPSVYHIGSNITNIKHVLLDRLCELTKQQNKETENICKLVKQADKVKVYE